MVNKQFLVGAKAPDGSDYVTLTDGLGTLINPPSSTNQIAGNASGTTGAVVGTLPNAGGVYTYISGFNVSAIGGTAAVGPIVVAGLAGGSQTYQMSASATGAFLQQNFYPALRANSINQAITITTTADGTATAVNVNSWGYQQ